MSAGPPTGKIKIVRVIARLNVGGAAVHVVLLNTRLNPARFESLLVSGTENPGEGSMLDFAQSQGVHPVVIPEIIGEASLNLRDLKALIKLYRLLRVERPHIVDTHTAKAGFLGRLAARLAGVPIVVHTYHGHILQGYYGPVKGWLLRLMERALARWTDSIIAVSDRVKRDLVAYGVAPAEKIAVVDLGFDLQPFLDCAAHRGEFRRELGLNNGARLVGTVGRIFPIKNHRLFIDAASRVAAREPGAHFVIVGDGVLRPAMEARVRELGLADRVIFTGWRRDLPSIYADLDVLVVSSDNEGTPVSVIEAMASGRPVVGTRVGGLPDLITEGQNGYLVTPRDADGLAEAILRLLNDEETALRMGRVGREAARQRFTIDRLTSGMESLYQRLLLNKGISA
jgi:glycosyltransferase involved in cell wall biosynthesis